MNLKIRLFVFFFTVVLIQSCGPNEDDYDQLVIIKTNKGDIKLILFNDTPMHKKSFLELAEKGAYDSTNFYRVMKDFMIQGGDISKNDEFEKESRRLIPSEIIPHYFHTKGMLGAARQPTSMNPNRQSSTQFYIVHGRKFSKEELQTDINKLNGSLPKYLYDGDHQELINEFKALQDSGRVEELQQKVLGLREEIEKELDMDFENTTITPEQIEVYTSLGGAPHLDGEYTVFGKVVEGLEIVDLIANLEVDSVDNPVEPVYMTIEVETILKDSLTSRYGILFAPVPENPAP